MEATKSNHISELARLRKLVSDLKAEFAREKYTRRSLKNELDKIHADMASGYLVRLPLRPGDRVWYYMGPDVLENGPRKDHWAVGSYAVSGVAIKEDGFYSIDTDFDADTLDKLGTNMAFLTKEEAMVAFAAEHHGEPVVEL